ncbi:MAG TPA: hypothetical protein VL633_05565 [Bacteroidota bacterium]|nr:hypothetical protein [Bacteroidota bacterium]
MRTFIEENEREVLLILVTMLAITRWWIPSVAGFENMYGASHWVLSYDYGLIRRGLVGAIFKMWMPIVTIEGVHTVALVAYCTLLALLLVVFYVLIRNKEKNGRLFRIILLFCACPATLALAAHGLGRFDLFLTILMFLILTLLSIDKVLWLVPVLATAGMFVHESFMILYAPTILATMIFLYGRKKSANLLAVFVVTVICVAGSFVALYKFGNPPFKYDEFAPLLQERAAFPITELSIRECYFSIRDHLDLASSSLYDVGSIVNVCMAVLMLSPMILILLNLWSHAVKNSGNLRKFCLMMFLATLSGLLLIPLATDYGRWLSAIVFCNFFAVFFLMSIDVFGAEELVEYSGRRYPFSYLLVFLTYLLFGPFHDWNPYPYMGHFVYTFMAIMPVLLFDVGFIMRWRAHRVGSEVPGTA